MDSRPRAELEPIDELLLASADNDLDAQKQMAFKSGFISLQERLRDWTKRTRDGRKVVRGTENLERSAPNANQQFATLYEFFQSKSSLTKQLERDQKLGELSKPKRPIMKLTKDDWNVKCWEERLASKSTRRKKRQTQTGVEEDETSPNRASRPELRVKTFSNRIDDVACKLDKVRVGAPLDEQLYRLSKRKAGDPAQQPATNQSGSWTAMLKHELVNGVHNPRLIRQQLSERTNTVRATSGPNKTIKSPWGQQIGRILDDVDE